MAISAPGTNAADYAFEEDTVDAAPKHGTTVQAGWAAAANLLKPAKSKGDYATDFRFSSNSQLVRFLGDEPFFFYNQHWIDRTEGKRSFVCLGDDCPLCIIANDKPRAKFAFNVLVISDEEPNVQILTAPITFARQLLAANEDPKRGPLSKYYWAISRNGSGNQTQYSLDRVRASDLAEDWELDSEEIDEIAANAKRYDETAVFVSPREELLTLARTLVS